MGPYAKAPPLRAILTVTTGYSLNAVPLPILRHSYLNASICPSYEPRGCSLGHFHSGLSLLPGTLPHAHMAGFDIGELCW